MIDQSANPAPFVCGSVKDLFQDNIKVSGTVRYTVQLYVASSVLKQSGR